MARSLLHRLYLPGGTAFFQLHLGADGRPDECRYFSLLDEVTPADRQEWGFWLDPRAGHDRLADLSDQGRQDLRTGLGARPDAASRRGSNRGDPCNMLDRTEQRQLQAMLYGAPDRRRAAGAAAPNTSWSARSRPAGQAWVEIDAGIDINPAALTLPSVPSDGLNGAIHEHDTGRFRHRHCSARSAAACRCCCCISCWCSVLLVVGILIYMAVTPFHERELLRERQCRGGDRARGRPGRTGHPARRAAGDDAAPCSTSWCGASWRSSCSW